MKLRRWDEIRETRAQVQEVLDEIEAEEEARQLSSWAQHASSTIPLADVAPWLLAPDAHGDASASDAVSEDSYFADRWLPDGLLRGSTLNPEAAVFVPRMPAVDEV